MTDILKNGFDSLGLDFNELAAKRFLRYFEMLDEKNKVMNLTAIYGKENTARLHFLDCAAVLKFFDFTGKSVIDIGTGAGFPGLPMKIAMPELSLSLLDSQRKRVDFLSQVCSELGFDDVPCIHARAEEYLQDLQAREAFDAVVSRAVSHLSVLCELCLPYVSVGGALVAMKGPDCREEISQSGNAVQLLGGGVPQVFCYDIPGTDVVHSVVIVQKVRSTPSKYPRRFAKIQKNPL